MTVCRICTKTRMVTGPFPGGQLGFGVTTQVEEHGGAAWSRGPWSARSLDGSEEFLVKTPHHYLCHLQVIAVKVNKLLGPPLTQSLSSKTLVLIHRPATTTALVYSLSSVFSHVNVIRAVAADLALPAPAADTADARPPHGTAAAV